MTIQDLGSHRFFLSFFTISASPFTGCYTDKGENFRANVSVTEKGLVCQRWNSSDPHHHIISTEDYPELAGGHNFCRNPGGKKKKPWCFTTDADTKFDFCDIPSCGKLAVVASTMELNGNLASCLTESSLKLEQNMTNCFRIMLFIMSRNVLASGLF